MSEGAGSPRGDWVEIREGPLHLLAAPAFAPACATALRSGQFRASFAAPRVRGDPGIVLSLADLPRPLHLRRLRHGGALGDLLGERFAGIGRAQHEIEVNRRLEQARAPVPTPVCALAYRRRGISFSQLAVGTLYEEGSENAAEFLARAPGEAQVSRICRAAGEAIRRFHDAGGRHADLHLGNLLITRGEALRVIDLDRCRFGSAPGATRRMRELMRLRRSLTKRGLEAGIGDAGFCLFFDSYAHSEEPLRRELLRSLRRERRRMRLHSWRYPSSRPVE